MELKKAFSIIFVTTLLAISIFAAGCTDIKPEPYIEDTATPTATVTATPTEIPTATVTATPTPTAVPQEYLIRITSYMFIPVGDKEINVGDTIKWRNFEDSKQPRTLISEDGIWDEEQYLRYMGSVSHTFNETGEYTFYLKGRDTKILTITVV